MSSSMELTPSKDGALKTFIKSQFYAKEMPIPPSLNLTGQTGIITGGNGGLGLECARMLLEHGLSRIILTARNAGKGEQAAAALRTAYPTATIEVLSLDLSLYASVQEFARRCSSLDRIDFAILNAGIALFGLQVNSSTKHEEMFQVNYLSTALLAILLLPILKIRRPKGGTGRLTVVSSGLAYGTKFPEQNTRPLVSGFDDPKQYNTDRYGTSKLLELMFVAKLQETIAPEDVIVNAVDPGFIGGFGGATDLHRSQPGLIKAIFGMVKLTTGRSIKSGASTYVNAAVLMGKESHGSFVFDWKISPFPKIMYTSKGKELIEQLWTETLDELQFAGVRGILTDMSRKDT